MGSQISGRRQKLISVTRARQLSQKLIPVNGRLELDYDAARNLSSAGLFETSEPGKVNYVFPHHDSELQREGTPDFERSAGTHCHGGKPLLCAWSEPAVLSPIFTVRLIYGRRDGYDAEPSISMAK